MDNKDLTVINLYGGPGSGKSTTAAGTFHLMKMKLYDVELVTEFAKDLVYQKRTHMFTEQDYISAKQHHRLRRLVQYGVKYCITDSPLLFAHLYAPHDYFPSFLPFINEVFNSYTNINIFIRRVKQYTQKGRVENEEEAKEIDRKNLELFFNLEQPFFVIDGNVGACKTVLTIISDPILSIEESLHPKCGFSYINPTESNRQQFFEWFDCRR
jgi:thymidylate kinase